MNVFVGKVNGVDTDLTLVLFDDQYEVIHDCIDIQKVPELDRSTYVPRGTTALLDAIGKTIKSVGERLSNTPENERPEKVIVAILTDGMENASREFKRSRIEEMITHQREKYGWEFIFLAANQDAIQQGMSMCIGQDKSFNYVSDGKGTRDAYAMMSHTVSAAKKSPDIYTVNNDE